MRGQDMRWLAGIMFVGICALFLLHLSDGRKGEQLNAKVAELQAQVDRQSEKIAELKSGLGYQVRVAALIEKGRKK